MTPECDRSESGPRWRRLKKEFGYEYVLVAPELATDGIDVLWDFSQTNAGKELIRGDTGQQVIREIVTDHLAYITRDRDGIPSELELRNWLPSKVTVNVNRSYGQPVFAGTGVRVADVAGMMRAGESAETVAEEFGLDIGDVRTAARILSWAAPPEFYIDENIAGRTIRRFISDLGYVVHTPAEVFGQEGLLRGVRNEDWLAVAGRNGWTVFGRDHHILQRELELRAYLAAKVHMFLLPGEALRAQIISLLERNLSEICAIAVGRNPNVYWLTSPGRGAVRTPQGRPRSAAPQEVVKSE